MTSSFHDIFFFLHQRGVAMPEGFSNDHSAVKHPEGEECPGSRKKDLRIHEGRCRVLLGNASELPARGEKSPGLECDDAAEHRGHYSDSELPDRAGLEWNA